MRLLLILKWLGAQHDDSEIKPPSVSHFITTRLPTAHNEYCSKPGTSHQFWVFNLYKVHLLALCDKIDFNFDAILEDDGRRRGEREATTTVV